MTPSASAHAAKAYFCTSLGRGDYYTEQRHLDQEIIGQWHGKTAELLGLSGTVTREAFNALADNLRPATGKQITPRMKDNRRAGMDMTFSVPKTVSAALELGGDDRILDAFREAVRETMATIESEMKTRVRVDGGNSTRVTGNLVWAEFIHRTARPIDGIPDPHLHAHAWCANVTWDPVEQRFKAADFGNLKRDAPYFQSLFDARMAEKLVQLGYAIERRRGGWELAEVAHSVVDRFSRRRDAIDRTASELGITDPDTKALLGATTRDRKQHDFSMHELRRLWWQRLTPDEVGAFCKMSGRGARGLTPTLDHWDTVDRVLAHAADHVFENASVVPQKDLLRAAFAFGVGQVTERALRSRVEELVRDGSMLRGEHDGRTAVTTRLVLEEERRLLDSVRNGRGQHAPINPEYFIGDTALSAEQRGAVKHALSSTDSVILIRGRAGVGKTRLMKEVVQGIEATGRPVLVAAPASMTTHEVLRGDGFTHAQNVAYWLKHPDTVHRLKGGVMWVDEAGQLSLPDLKKLVRLAEKADARLLLTGDTRQHRSVRRGDALRLLETQTGLRIAEVKEIRRQERGDYREAAKQLSRGDLEQGFASLDRMGAIREIAEGERESTLAAKYQRSVNAGKVTLVVSPTHAEGRAVSEAIRSRLRDEGVIARESHSVDQLRPRHLTAAERSDAAVYREGDVVQFHQNAKGGFRIGDRGEIVKCDKGRVAVRRERDGVEASLPLGTPQRFNVFERQRMELAVGDRIRITHNGKTACGKHKLYNGTFYGIDSIQKDGTLRLENGWKIGKKFGHLTQGYCVTSDAAQGRTVDHIIIAQSDASAAASSVQQFYTSVTRGRTGISIFTDDKQRLLQSAARDTSRVSATEFVRALHQGPRQPERQHRRSLGLWIATSIGERFKRLHDRVRTRERSMNRHREQARQRRGFERER